jgi:hypothetical protein
MSDILACEHCGGANALTTEIQPLGGESGYRISFCEGCRRYTWAPWRIAQQQQQPQKKE